MQDAAMDGEDDGGYDAGYDGGWDGQDEEARSEETDGSSGGQQQQQQAAHYRRKVSVEELNARLAQQPASQANAGISQPRRVVVVAPSEESKGATPAKAATPARTGIRRKAEPKWARESAALRDALAASRVGGNSPAKPDDANDGRVACPHCQRRFKPEVAERHIPLCQGLKTKPRTVTGSTAI